MMKAALFLSLDHLNFGFVSVFVLRISDFPIYNKQTVLKKLENHNA